MLRGAAAPATPVAAVQATIVLSPPSHAAASVSGIWPARVSRCWPPKRLALADCTTHTPCSVATAASIWPFLSVTRRPRVAPARPPTSVRARATRPPALTCTAWALLQQVASDAAVPVSSSRAPPS